MVINSSKIMSNTIVWSLYLSAFSQLLQALLLSVSNLLSTVFLLLSQTLFYITPIFLFFFVSTNKIKFLIIIFFIVLLLLMTTFKHIDAVQIFLGVKNYFLILFYIPIIARMHDDSRFRERMERAIRIIFISYALIAVFEMISVFYPTSLYIDFRNLAGERMMDIPWRPYGGYLNIHTQGIVLALGSMYFLFARNKLFFSIAFIGLLMSSVKTWIIAFFIILFTYIIFNIQKVKNVIILMIIILSVFIFIYYAKDAPVLGYYYQELVQHEDSSGSSRMIEKILTFEQFIIDGLTPYGFSARGFSSLLEGSSNDVPSYYLENEIFFYDMLYQVGVVITAFWIFLIYSRLLTFKNGFIFKNQYKTLLAMSLFSFVHTCSLHLVFIFIIVVYFSEFSKKTRAVYGSVVG